MKIKIFLIVAFWFDFNLVNRILTIVHKPIFVLKYLIDCKIDIRKMVINIANFKAYNFKRLF